MSEQSQAQAVKWLGYKDMICVNTRPTHVHINIHAYSTTCTVEESHEKSSQTYVNVMWTSLGFFITSFGDATWGPRCDVSPLRCFTHREHAKIHSAFPHVDMDFKKITTSQSTTSVFHTQTSTVTAFNLLSNLNQFVRCQTFIIWPATFVAALNSGLQLAWNS